MRNNDIRSSVMGSVKQFSVLKERSCGVGAQIQNLNQGALSLYTDSDNIDVRTQHFLHHKIRQFSNFISRETRGTHVSTHLKALERSFGEDLGEPNTMFSVPRRLELSRFRG